MLHDVSSDLVRVRPGEVVVAVVVVETDSENGLRGVHFVAEINVVYFVSVSFVHISFEQKVHQLIGSVDLELSADSHELGLCHVSVFGDIEALELGLHAYSSDLDSVLVLAEELLNEGIISVVSEVLSPGQKGVLLSDGLDHVRWVLVHSFLGERRIDVLAEIVVVEHVVLSFVFSDNVVEFIVSEREIEHRNDSLELVGSYFSLSELVEISEEFFDSYSLHHDAGSDSVLDVAGVVCDVDGLGSEAALENVDAVGGASVEGRLWANAFLLNGSWRKWTFCNVFWEHVFWLVNIVAEIDVVDLLEVALVVVLSGDELGELRVSREEIELFQDSQELVLGDVTAPGLIKVLEGRLEHDSVCHDLEPDILESTDQSLLFFLGEDREGFGVVADGVLVSAGFEDGLDIVAEVCVTDKSLASAVLADHLLDLLFSERKLQSTNACAELEGQGLELKGILRQIQQRSLFLGDRNRGRIL